MAYLFVGLVLSGVEATGRPSRTDADRNVGSGGAGAPPVVIVPGPYNVSFTRANGGNPFISSHFDAGQDGRSDFYFNLVPSYLQLPGGQDALIVRSVNGTSWATGTTSTTRNPDKLTLTTFVKKDGAGNMDSVSVQPIHASSVIFEPTGPEEACGVQDPRITYNPADHTYYMTYCTYGPPLPKDPKTNPLGIMCGGAGVGLATSKTPDRKESWVRHGYNCNNGTADNCGKSAAILVRETGPHYMFWGIPTIAVSTSYDLLNWTLINPAWVVPDGGAATEMWIEAGSPPEQLSDGNYIMSYNIADGDLWWGIGYLILDKDDPTKILQRESRMLWPTLPWERADPTNPATSWEAYKNCIGAMNSLHPLPTKDEFVGYYVGGDSVAGAAKIAVTKGPCYPKACPPPPTPPPPPLDCEFLPNVQLYDPGSAHTSPPHDAVDEAACCRVCMSIPDCVGAVLYGASCYPKTAVLPQVKQQGVTACVRKNSSMALAP